MTSKRVLALTVADEKSQKHLQPPKMNCLLLSIALLGCTSVSVSVLAANPPPQVTVRKCCPLDQELRLNERMDTDSVLEAVQCVPSNVTSWVPRIKFKKREGFFGSEGTKPKFMTFEANKLPLDSCSDPMHSSGPNGVFLLTDGSLIVNDRGLLITKSERFCVDRESAIYCLPQDNVAAMTDPGDERERERENETSVPTPGKWQRRRTTIRKCCGQGWAYNALQKTCVHLNNPMNPLHGKAVFDQSLLRRTRLDLLYGFPTSCDQANYAILGTFKQEMFDEERNVLRLENADRQLRENEFCLEHMVTRENDTVHSSFVTVFTCTEFFPSSSSSGQQPEQNEIPRVS